MISFLRKYVSRPLSFLLGIYMINLCVDASDQEGHFDPSINEIESVIELVQEIFLGNEGFIPEEDEPDPESETCFVHLCPVVPESTYELRVPIKSAPKNQPAHVDTEYSDPSLSIVSPPPKS